MELVIFAICITFSLIFTFFGLRYVQFSGISLIFCIWLIGALLTDGLTETIGYVSGSPIEIELGVEIVILVPMVMAVLNSLLIREYYRGKGGSRG